MTALSIIVKIQYGFGRGNDTTVKILFYILQSITSRPINVQKLSHSFLFHYFNFFFFFFFFFFLGGGGGGGGVVVCIFSQMNRLYNNVALAMHNDF